MSTIKIKKSDEQKLQELTQEFPCHFCHKLADRIVHYYKYDGEPSLENPVLSCKECEAEANAYVFQSRGGIEGTGKILFSQIVSMNEIAIGTSLLAGRKGRINHLAWARGWRKRIWRIHFCFKPRKADKENGANASNDHTSHENGNEERKAKDNTPSESA